MAIRRIDHTAIFVADLARTVDWYSQVLEMEPAYVGDTGNDIPGAFFDVGDTLLAILTTASSANDLTEQHFAFAVDNADSTYADLVARGFKPEAEPLDLPTGYIQGQRGFDLLDPDGIRVEFVERVQLTIDPYTLHPDRSGS